MRDPYHLADALHLRIEVGVAQKAPDESGDFILSNIHHYEAIARVTQFGQIEIRIASEEHDISLPAQKHDDLFVLHSFAPEIDSNLPCRHPGGFQQESLAIENILVQYDQARARSSTYSGAVYWAE